MLWHVTGRPLRAYQVGCLVAGVLLNVENLWIVAGVFIFLLGGSFFHTGKEIPWTIGYQDKETWIHCGIVFFMMGAGLGFVMSYSNFWIEGWQQWK